MENLFDISGRVAVVTGGSRGIGAMIARGLLKHGVKVYITARKEHELLSAREELSVYGTCIALQTDLSTLAGIDDCVAQLRARESAVDFLVNNAGATWGAPFAEYPEQGWDRVMDLNVKGLFFLTQRMLPMLRSGANAERRSRIINIGSVDGLVNSHVNNYAYSASKAAVHHLTRHLSADLARDHINVNAIAPGLFPSKMTAHLLPKEKEWAQSFPINRIGSPEDITGTVVYLCSRASAWMTGQVLALDGGLVANA